MDKNLTQGIKGSGKASSTENSSSAKIWSKFCQSEWNMDDDLVSDIFVMYAFKSDLMKVSKGKDSFDIISQSARHCLRNCGVVSGNGAGFTVHWDTLNKFLNMLPAPKQG